MTDLRTVNEQDFFTLFKKKPHLDVTNSTGENVPRADVYYHNIFNRFKNNPDKVFSWNWAAFFFSALWMAYRKMYMEAFLFIVIYCVTIVPVILWSSAAMVDSTTSGVGAIAYLGSFVLAIVYTYIAPGMFGNALYFRKLKKKYEDKEFVLGRKPTSIISIFVFYFAMIALILAVGVGIMLTVFPEALDTMAKAAAQVKEQSENLPM